MKERPKAVVRRLRAVARAGFVAGDFHALRDALQTGKSILPPAIPPPPATALRDRTYAEIGDELAAVSVELAHALGDRLTPCELGHVRAAFTCVNQAAVALLTLDEELHKLRVQSLDNRCRCGWDRGSHMVAPPHLCEEDPRCPGFALAHFDTERAPA